MSTTDIYKVCIKCNELKSTDCFYKDKRSKDGLYSSCKTCWAIYRKAYYGEYYKNEDHLNKRREQSKEQYRRQGREYRRGVEQRYRQQNIGKCRQRERQYYQDNKEYRKRYDKEYREQNKAVLAQQQRKYYEEHREELLEYYREYYISYYETNKDAFYARSQQRIGYISQATPTWAETDKIVALYQRRREIQEQTGIPHHVDHIVPLRGKLVCGLHCLANLRIIPAEENQVKGNKLIESLLFTNKT